MRTRDSDPLWISTVLHTAYCPRRTWLELNGERTDTYQMQAGTSAHSRTDDQTESRPGKQRAVRVSSSVLGVAGKVDLLETVDDAKRIIDYKTTPVRFEPKVTEANKVQLALQTICLEEAGEEVDGAAIRFLDHNKTVNVLIDSDLRQRATDLVEETRRIANSKIAPEPLEDDSRCRSCSHISVCLPDERRGEAVERRIVVSNPDSQVLHLTEQGSYASIRSGRIIVSKAGEKIATVPLERVNGIVVHGNIDLSSALIRELHWNRQAVVWCSSSGRAYGFTQPIESPNGLARARQGIEFADGRLDVARELIAAKIHNQTVFLRRNGGLSPSVARMKESLLELEGVSSLREIFGVEGEAAATYFGAFGSLLKEASLDSYSFNWAKRIGRGANDPINVLLNYAYGLLQADCTKAILATGLDPHIGVLHSSNRNKPALTLDLMEEFRPVIADSVVVTIINKRELPKNAFTSVGGSIRLTPDGRRSLVRAYERRAQTKFTHPIFGYEVTWRRAIEIQARMLLGIVDGTQAKYVGVKVR